MDIQKMFREIEEPGGRRRVCDRILAASEAWTQADETNEVIVSFMTYAVAGLNLEDIDKWIDVLMRLSESDKNVVPISKSRTLHYLTVANRACLIRNESVLQGLYQRLDPTDVKVGDPDGDRYFTRQYRRLGLAVRLINNQVSERSMKRFRRLFAQWTPNEAFSDFLCVKVNSTRKK